EIISMYETIVGRKFELFVDAKRLRGYDIQLLAGNHAAMMNSVGWKPVIEFQQTLTDLYDYWMKKDN
ncbi:MAG TPA: hypothetical protein VK470_13320, partial [Bacteroidota bacterium]|nr:hypothetical protein [Bacteroidota bacterium]